MWHTSARISLDTEGRSPSPRARDRQVPEPTKSFAVPAHNGLTVTSARVQADHVEDSHIQNRRSMRPNRRRPVFRCSRASCCRKREVVEHKLAPRPNRRANRPVQSIRSETPRCMLDGRYLCVNLRDPVFASTTTCCRPPPPLSPLDGAPCLLHRAHTMLRRSLEEGLDLHQIYGPLIAAEFAGILLLVILLFVVMLVDGAGHAAHPSGPLN